MNCNICKVRFGFFALVAGTALLLSASFGMAQDLVVESLSLDKSFYSPGESATVTVTVRNQGEASTGSGFIVDVFRNKSSAVACSTPYNFRVSRPALAAGASDTFSFPITQPTNLGSYTMRAYADSTCLIAEDQEDNNQATAAYAVGSDGSKDLVVLSVSLNKDQFDPGETATVTISVQNQGAGSTLKAFYVDMFRDKPGAVDCGTTYNYRVSRPPLPAGAIDTFSFAIPQTAKVGTYTMRAFADSSCVVDESNETNNQATFAYTVGNPGLPDLIVESISFDKASYLPNETATVTVTVKNIGNGSTGAGFSVDLYRNMPGSANCSDPYNFRVARPALAGGASDTFSFPMTQPSTVGTFTMRAFADAMCAVEEVDETNNQNTLAYTVGKAELVIVAFYLDKGNYNGGETATVTVSVQNLGYGPVGSIYSVDVYRDRPTEVGCSAPYNFRNNRRVPAANGGIDTFSFTLIQPSTKNGNFKMRAFADSVCIVDETDETNNQAQTSYTISNNSKTDVTVTNTGTPTGGK